MDLTDGGEWGGLSPLLDDPDERRVLFAALDSFQRAHHNITHVRRQAFYALPSAHWERLSRPPVSYLSTLDAVDAAIDANAVIAEGILRAGLQAHGLPFEPPGGDRLDWRGTATSNDHDKARTTVRQFYRDWSAEGAGERAAHFNPVLDALATEFPSRRDRRRVLVPGAGLGRLLLSVCLAGFDATGNEISHHALLGSSWVLNHLAAGETYPLHPFALSFANHASRESQVRAVQVPDTHAGTALGEAGERAGSGETPAWQRLGMAAGDFIPAFSSPDERASFDAVATVFFIDTAPNLMRYIDTVHACLKPGGVWVNCGPLLWHFEPGEKIAVSGSRSAGRGDVQAANLGHEHGHGHGHGHERDHAREMVEMGEGIHESGAVELTDAEVRALVADSGFVVERHELRPAEQGYIADPASLLSSRYAVSFWVARKKDAASAAVENRP